MKFKCKILHIEDRSYTGGNIIIPPKLHLNLVLETINEVEGKALKDIIGTYI